jgi:serine/threonine-protein kinase HipA
VKVKPVTALGVFYEPEEGRRIKVGRLARQRSQLLFEYEAAFVDTGLQLSPLRLPLQRGLVVGNPAVFDGLMGVFEDSLPDGWGRLLIDRRAHQGGLSPEALGPLDRLSLVGSAAMGALVYEPEVELQPPSIVKLPEIEADAIAVLRDASGPDLDRLIALGGSPQGARPKALVQVGDDGRVVFGDRRHRAGCVHYLVKFRARGDDRHAGTLEHAYSLMAAAAGLDVPSTTMLGRTRRHPGYFAIRRFDREGTRKIHMHTLSGLLHASHRIPTMTYRGCLETMRELTLDERAVTEMFRRACFNVLAHNRDDHTRNVAFLMDEDGRWRPSPAYDLTYSDGPGGEHAMLLGRDGAHPTSADLLELARGCDVKRPKPILDQVRSAIARFERFADEAGLPAAARARVAAELRPDEGRARR